MSLNRKKKTSVLSQQQVKCLPRDDDNSEVGMIESVCSVYAVLWRMRAKLIKRQNYNIS